MKATIQNAKIMRIDKVFKRHKPQGLGFSDNDAIILDLKTEDGTAFAQTFYCRLKGDGTLGRSITSRSRGRQMQVQIFLKKYISKDKKYNVRENIDKWKGKEVEVEKLKGGFIIKI